MKHDEFMSIVESEYQRCKRVLLKKSEHYSEEGEDRLEQFKCAARLERTTPLTALAGFLGKHVTKFYLLISREERGILIKESEWNEVIGDIHNYLFLAKGIMEEEKK
jgi:hypothetical protein